MMHQEQFPGFQKYYRQLRAEGIVFPDRDLNERTMMENLEGINSPMFEFLEQADIKNKERKSKVSTGKKSLPKEDKKCEDDEDEEVALDINSAIKMYESKIEAIKNVTDYIEEPLKDIEEIENINYTKYQCEIFDKSDFDFAKSNISILENMASNCESFHDFCTSVIIELYQTTVKSAIKISKIMDVRRKAKISEEKDLELIESVHEIQGKIESFRKRYLKTKKKDLKNLENQKRVLVKQKRKQDKLKRKQDKIRSKEERLHKQIRENNPFDVMDETNCVMGYAGAMNQPAVETPAEESSSDTSSDLSDDNFEQNDNDDSESSDDLHQPISMWSILYYGNNKGKKKEKKIVKKESQKSSHSRSNSEYNKGGFLRNSVLVQKTINFFGRKSKPLKNESSGEEDNKIDLKANKRNSNMKPSLNEFFVQTAKNSNIECRQEESAKINKEIKIDFFHDNKNNSSEEKEEKKEEQAEVLKHDKPPVFVYKAKEKCDLPMQKSKSKVSRDSVSIKKIIAPPKSANFRNSIAAKPCHFNLLGD